MKSIQLLAAVAAVTVSSLALATAPAQMNGDAPSVVVQYSESSLATATGVKNLHSRLRFAAQSVATLGNDNLTNYHRTRSLPRALAAN